MSSRTGGRQERSFGGRGFEAPDRCGGARQGHSGCATAPACVFINIDSGIHLKADEN